MKRIFGLLFLSAAVVVGVSVSAVAQANIYFNGSTEASFNSVGTGIYGGTLNGNPASFICDDYPDHISGGESWQANGHNLENLAGVLFSPNPNGRSTLQAYSEVAWLAENIFSDANTNGSGVTDPSTLSWAIWTILDSPAAGPGGTGALVTAADAWWGALSAPCQLDPVGCGAVQDVNIWTPIAGTQPAGDPYPQEFLSQVPEPVSMVLMGTFLSLAGLLLGKKRLMA